MWLSLLVPLGIACLGILYIPFCLLLLVYVIVFTCFETPQRLGRAVRSILSYTSRRFGRRVVVGAATEDVPGKHVGMCQWSTGNRGGGRDCDRTIANPFCETRASSPDIHPFVPARSEDGSPLILTGREGRCGHPPWEKWSWTIRREGDSNCIQNSRDGRYDRTRSRNVCSPQRPSQQLVHYLKDKHDTKRLLFDTQRTGAVFVDKCNCLSVAEPNRRTHRDPSVVMDTLVVVHCFPVVENKCEYISLESVHVFARRQRNISRPTLFIVYCGHVHTHKLRTLCT